MNKTNLPGRYPGKWFCGIFFKVFSMLHLPVLLELCSRHYLGSKKVVNIPKESLIFFLFNFHSSASEAIWRGLSESVNNHCHLHLFLAAHKIENSVKLTPDS